MDWTRLQEADLALEATELDRDEFFDGEPLLERGWYSSEEFFWRGHPMFRVLIDGGHWQSPSTQDFKFGCMKANMILGAMEIIRLFDETEGVAPVAGNHIQVALADGSGLVRVTKCDFFERQGRRILEPYLRLESQGVRIGLGRRKAHGLRAVEPQLALS